MKADTKKDVGKEYALLINELLIRAKEAYKRTDEYMSFQKEIEKTRDSLKSNLEYEDYILVAECFNEIMKMSDQEKKYFYNAGIKDGVVLLKKRVYVHAKNIYL